MKIKPVLYAVAALLLSTLNSPLSTVYAQGSLTPPGAPAPTMKTLAQIEPRTPISSSPFVIAQPGSYYLTTNLTGISGQHGINILCSDVTLDLSGFGLFGVPGAFDGILILQAATNVTVRNGTIRGWPSYGAVCFNASTHNVTFEHLNISSCGQVGIYTYGASIRDCSVTGGTYGIEPINSDVRNCSVTSAAVTGIYAFDSAIRDCRVQACGSYGIWLEPGTATGCLVEDCMLSGIYVNLPGSQVIGNTCLRNNATNSALSAGIYVFDSNNRIENNNLSGNGALGAGILLKSAYPNNVVVRNTVFGHGANNYVIPGAQIVGPIITNVVSGIITNSNPWANFSF